MARRVGGVRRRRRAAGADALPAGVASAQAVRKRSRHPPDRRHPALCRRRLVRRLDASGAVRQHRRRRRRTVAEPSRGAALGDAGLRLGNPRRRRLHLVARAARARARVVRRATPRSFPGPRAVLAAPARRARPGERLVGDGPGSRVLRRRARTLRGPAADRRGPGLHHAGRGRASRGDRRARHERRRSGRRRRLAHRFGALHLDARLGNARRLVGAMGPGEPAAARGRIDVRRGRASRVAAEHPRGRERAGDHPRPGSPRPRERGAHEPARHRGRHGTGSGSSNARSRQTTPGGSPP